MDRAIVKAEKKKENGVFFSGVAVLTLSMLLVKAIGALFKIPMIKYVGIEGMGYFNAAYHFYSLLMTVSTAGLPVALSILISGDLSVRNICGVKNDYQCAVKLFCSVGAVFSLLMLLFSERIAVFLGIPNTKYCLAAVSPAVLFVTVSGAVRGYFQGHGIMTPTAISQVIESLGKLLLGLGLAFFAIRKNKPPYIVAAYAIFGLTLGLLIAALYLIFVKYLYDKKHTPLLSDRRAKTNNKRYSALFRMALPVTLSSAVLSLTALLDTLVIPNSLMNAGIDESTAINLYSTYTNLALPMFALPTAFITPISLVLIPAASAAFGAGNRIGRIKVFETSFRLCAFMTLPCVFVMGVLSYPMLSVVFSDNSYAVSIGAKLLSVLSASVFFSGLITVSNAMLQSCERQTAPMISLALGAGVKLIGGTVMISMPKINIFGAPISTFLCSLTVLAVNFYFLTRATEESFSPIKLFLRPLTASAIAGAACAVCYHSMIRYFSMITAFLLCAVISVLVYIPLSLRIRAFSGEDILLLPRGDKIYFLLQKIKLIKQNDFIYNTEVKHERRKKENRGIAHSEQL